MFRMMDAWIKRYHRWKYVEDDLATPCIVEAPSADTELLRARRAIERAEQQLAHYRQNGCAGLARECDATLRALRNRLAALKF